MANASDDLIAVLQGRNPWISSQTSLLPTSLATTLMEEGRMRGQQPAGT